MTINKRFEGIEIFVEVVKQGSFAAAAESLEHSNSHISKEINKLETRLKSRLLNRTTRSLALTPEGEIYYEHCLRLMSDAEVAYNLIASNDDTPRGQLKISCPVGLCHSHLQPVLAEYLSDYPNVTLDLELNDKKVDIVADGYDLVIRATPLLDESSLICRRIFSCKTVIVASKSYLAKHQRPYHPNELVNHNCICYSNLKLPGRWEFIGEGNKTFHVDVRQRIRCNNGQMELEFVKAGLGISRLPEFYLINHIQDESIEELFPEFKQPEVNVYAIYPTKKHLSPKVRAFIDKLIEFHSKKNTSY